MITFCMTNVLLAQSIKRIYIFSQTPEPKPYMVGGKLKCSWGLFYEIPGIHTPQIELPTPQRSAES